MTDNAYLSNTAQPALTWTGSDTSTTTDVYTIDPKHWEYYSNPSRVGIITGITEWEPENNKKGDDDMRYLYEVILVNPKNDEWFADKFVAKTETSALMQAYDEYFKALNKIKFDDLKTSCRELMSWKKEKSLKKAIKTIKEAVE